MTISLISRLATRLRRLAGARDRVVAPPPGAAAIARAGAGLWTPTHRHRKGGLYRLLAVGTFEADRSAVAIYDDRNGTIWVRSLAEFRDGRFAPL